MKLPKELDATHVIMELPDETPDSYTQDLLENLNAAGMTVAIRKHPSVRMYASLEWAVPTAMVIWVLKPYFESFLKEAGKDHYPMLKGWLKRRVNEARFKFSVFSLSGGRIRREEERSRAISLLVQTKSGQVIKLLFNENLKKEDWDQAIDYLLDFVIENYEKESGSRLERATHGLDKHPQLEIYAVMDADKKSLKFYDCTGLITLERQKREGSGSTIP